MTFLSFNFLNTFNDLISYRIKSESVNKTFQNLFSLKCKKSSCLVTLIITLFMTCIKPGAAALIVALELSLRHCQIFI